MRPTERLLPIQLLIFKADSGKMPLGFPIQQSERALTAARPSRTLTAFPFSYPEAIRLQDLQLGYDFFKEQSFKTFIRLSFTIQEKMKKIIGADRE